MARRRRKKPKGKKRKSQAARSFRRRAGRHAKALAVVLLLAAAAVAAWFANKSKNEVTAQRGQPVTTGATDELASDSPAKVRELAERWLSAVAAGDGEVALAAANRLVNRPVGLPNRRYVALGKSEGIRAAYFDRPFNRLDYQAWRHAYFFQQAAWKITGDRTDDITALQAAVVERVSPNEPQVQGAWPYGIWQRGFGLCDRQAWVLCELAYQLGWETQIVYLRDPKTNASPHTLCELRKGADRVWYADPYFKLLLPQKSVAQVAADERLLMDIWPDKENCRMAIKNCMFWTPAYPQDYRPLNQALYKRLSTVLKSRCPRFGIDPIERMKTYRQLRAPSTGRSAKFPMALWVYPFRVLRADLLREVKSSKTP